MSSTVTLLMAIHCHQPVGNFGFVFEKAYEQSYEPFLAVLERHPKVRLALHYSGSLLDWFKQERPEFLKRIRGLAQRNQAEILSSGYYEPILPLLPEADRQGQLSLMREFIKKTFGAQATGLWLTERVWEPELPATLARAGIRYTMVDTNQFKPAKPWLSQRLQVETGQFWDVLGSYTTDYSGQQVRLFPASKQLRYTMPFQPVDKTIDFLRRLAQERPVAITFADDGEKFGFWPETHDWVYKEGWLDKFFSALEQESSWLKTDTFAHYAGETPADGRVYLPCGSYEEMLEWSNGYFRNFFTKYPEANAMQQAMLRISESLGALKALGSRLEGKAKKPQAYSLKPTAKHRLRLLEQATQQLYAGQCNCAYWHGVFGGLYLAHLRRAVYAHLIRAEQLANQLQKTPAYGLKGVDGDGSGEVRITTHSQALAIDPRENGSVASWNLYGPAVNLVDTLSRRPEPYHQKLRKLQESSVAASAAAAPESIHDAVKTKEGHLTDHLLYDDHRRTAFHDYGLDRMPSLEEVFRSTWSERRLWSPGPYRLEKQKKAAANAPVTVCLTRDIQGGLARKEVAVSRHYPGVDFTYALENVQAPVVALEFNVCLRDERFLKAPQPFEAVRDFQVIENWSGIRVSLALDKPARLYVFPVETVSDSEGGMERTYQGLCLVFLWQRDSAASFRSRIEWKCGER